MYSYSELACGIVCGSLPILPLLWHHLSQRSRGTGGISLRPVRTNQANGHTQGDYSSAKVARNWDDAYEASQQAKRDWVKLEEGPVVPLPKSYLESEESDEQAINDAIVGRNGAQGTTEMAKRLSMRVSGHMAGKTGHGH